MPAQQYDILGPGLSIEDPVGDLNFCSQARMALNSLRSRDVGRLLIKAICDACEASGHQVIIEKSAMATAVPTDDISEAFRAQLNQPGNGLLVDHCFLLTVRGQAGCSGIARWNPSNTIPGTNIQRPSYLSLAHELIHCLHYVSADCARAPTRQFDLTINSGLAEEEARTVGLGAYDWPDTSEQFCENAIRDAFGIAKRTEYMPGVDLSAARRTI